MDQVIWFPIILITSERREFVIWRISWSLEIIPYFSFSPSLYQDVYYKHQILSEAGMNELQLSQTCYLIPCRPSASSGHYLASFNHGQLISRHKVAVTRQGAQKFGRFTSCASLSATIFCLPFTF